MAPPLGFTESHTLAVSVANHGGGPQAALDLEKANIIVNKNLLPQDKPEDWDYPSGLRIGTIEVTRLGMKEPEMAILADLIAEVLVAGATPESVLPRVLDFRAGYQQLYYCFENGLPA